MANDAVRELLEDARSLIADPEAWCTGALFKRDKGWGAAVTPDAVDAERMCAMGALLKAMDEEANVNDLVNPRIQEARLYLESALDKLPDSAFVDRLGRQVPRDACEKVERFNDQTRHESVVDLFNIAIKDAINADEFDE